MTTQNMTDNFAGGKAIIQAQYVFGGGSATASLTPVDITGTSVSITPTSSSNKILIMVSLVTSQPSSADNSMYIQVLRGGGVIGGSPYARLGTTSSTINQSCNGCYNFTYMDNPATTSSTTYKLQQYVSDGSVTVTTSNVNVILMEVVA